MDYETWKELEMDYETWKELEMDYETWKELCCFPGNMFAHMIANIQLQ